MLRVLCIDDKDRPNSVDSPSGWDIIEREVYTVCDEYISDDNKRCYSLEEDPDCEYYGYEADRFIPLSDIDEQEMAVERAIKKIPNYEKIKELIIKSKHLV